MDNETFSTLSSEVTLEAYQSTIQTYMILSSYAVLIYGSLLRFPDEVEYIWKQKITLPTYLYLLSKYPLLFYPPLIVVADSLQLSSLCNDLDILSKVLFILPFLGVQGLISVRTYALCQNYRRLVAAVIFVLMSVVLASTIYGTTVPICTMTSVPKTNIIVNLIANIMVALLDMLSFIAVVHRVLGPWKLKRSTSLRSNEDLTTSILEQGTLRFCFLLLFTSAGVFLSFFAPIIANDLGSFQNILSSLLICEFTLDLRKRDAKKASPSAINLPTISFRENPVKSITYALGRLHDSVVAEMGERNELVAVDRDGSGSGEPDSSQNSAHESDTEVV